MDTKRPYLQPVYGCASGAETAVFATCSMGERVGQERPFSTYGACVLAGMAEKAVFATYGVGVRVGQKRPYLQLVVWVCGYG